MAGRNLFAAPATGRNLFAPDPAAVETPTPVAPALPIPQPDQPVAQPDVTPESISKTIKEEPGIAEQFSMGIDIGLNNIFQGLGIGKKATPEQQQEFKNLTDDFFAASIGEAIGESAPFLPLATIGPIAGITSFAGRIGLSGLLGGTEGGLIARGKGQDPLTGASIGTGIAVTAETVLPIVGKAIGKIFSKTGKKPAGELIDASGNPTPELQTAMKETNTKFSDITNEVVAELKAAPAGVDPTQAARAARFESLGIPATKGDISQEFAQQAQEQRLLTSATSEAAAPLRDVKLQQSNAFVEAATNLVDELGVPSRTGESVKAALTGRKDLLRTEKNALYKEFGDAAPEIANAPIFTDDIAESLPSAETLEDIAIVGANVDGIEKALVRFGVDTDPGKVAKYVEGGGTITPLTLGNFDRFRKVLGGLERADQTGSSGVAIGPIRKALDEEATFIDDALRESGITDAGVIKTLKEARSRVTEIKTEFSPQAISGRLIGVKRDGRTPVIEASKVAQELLRPTAPIENLQRVLSNLSRGGPKGTKAVQDLRASVVMDALEAGLSAPSRKTGGIETIGGNQFAKALSKFGDDKLDVLFRGNEKALNSLRNLKQTALDISPAAAATPQGTERGILDIFNRIGRIPGLTDILDTIKFVKKIGNDSAKVKKALDANPEVAKKVASIQTNYPAIFSALNIPIALEAIDNE